MEKRRAPGLVEIIVLLVVIILLWNFTDFKEWLWDEGNIIRVLKKSVGL